MRCCRAATQISWWVGCRWVCGGLRSGALEVVFYLGGLGGLCVCVCMYVWWGTCPSPTNQSRRKQKGMGGLGSGGFGGLAPWRVWVRVRAGSGWMGCRRARGFLQAGFANTLAAAGLTAATRGGSGACASAGMTALVMVVFPAWHFQHSCACPFVTHVLVFAPGKQYTCMLRLCVYARAGACGPDRQVPPGV